MWIYRPIHQGFSSPNPISFMNVDVFATWNKIFTLLAVVGDHQHLASALLKASKLDHAVDLGDDRLLFRFARLEQLGNSWQTTRDIFGLSRFPWDLGDDIAGGHMVLIVH